MALADENAVYSQLTAAPTFQPAVATLFSDWAVEPGDIVQVQSEGNTYSVPVYSSTLTWMGGYDGDGTSLLEIQSTGNQTRAPLPALKRREYASGAGGHGAAKEQEEKFKQFERAVVDTDELLGLYAYEFKEDKNAQEGRILVAETAIEQTAREILLRARTSYMEARLSVTAEAIRAEMENMYDGLRAYIRLTADYLRSEFTGLYDGLRSYVELTRQHLLAEFEDAKAGLKSYIELTAGYLRTEFTGQYDGLRSYVELTRQHLITEFQDADAGLKSYIEVTASYLRSEFTNQYNGLRGYVEVTASGLRTEFTNQYQGLRGYVVQTASYLQAEYTSQYTGLRGYVVLTADRLKTEFTNQYNSAISRITQNAEGITTLVTKTGINDLGQNQTLLSRITQSDENITSLVAKTGIGSLGQNETLFSRITQNADGITTIVSKTGINSLGQGQTLFSRISQSAEDITTLVTKTGINNLGSSQTLYSKISQNANSISAEVTNRSNADDALSSRITVNANAITTKVSNGDIASTINQTAQGVKISASKINLEGYVTVSELSTERGRIDNLIAGTTHLAGVYCTGGILGQSWIAAANWINGTDVQISGTSLKSAITGIGTASASSGSITIPTTRFDGTAGPSINFNIADTQYYKDGVSAAMNAGWGAAQGKVSWPGDGSLLQFTYSVPSSTVGETFSKTYTITQNAWDNGNKIVRVRDSNFTYVGQITVTTSEASNWSISGTASGTSVSLTVNGKSFSHNFSDYP